MRRTAALLPASLLLIAPHGLAVAQRPLNLDFEQASVSYADRPWGWGFGFNAFAGVQAATFTLDSTVHHAGRHSLRIAAADTTALAPHAIMLQLPARFARGRTLRLTAWTRGDSIAQRARILLEAWKDRAFAAADTAVVERGSGGPGWVRRDLAIRVPPDSTIHSIVVTVSLLGPGTVWFDDCALSLDGRPIASLPDEAPPPTARELRWLEPHASALHTVRASSESEESAEADLARFASIVGDARVVGLGESTHGTHEFFELKHRLVDYAVRRLGFRVFAIEANQLAVENINRYVEGGPGATRDVMRVMFRVWYTEEMAALIDWIRAWNTAHPDRAVRFVGYDMQDNHVPADTLRAFLARVEPGTLVEYDAAAAPYRAQSGYATPQVPDTTRARWARQIDSLWRDVTARRAAWLERATNRGDTIATEWAVQSANLLRQAARFNVALNSPERDSLMAANLAWSLATLAPGQRAVVWAHDVHVSKGGDPARSFNEGQQMGAFLRRIYGDGYRCFSLETYEGTYSATRSFTDHVMIAARGFPAPPGSFEAALHGLRRPASSVGWIVDLRAARSGPGGAWLRRLRPLRHIGYAAYDYGFDLNADLPLEFDGVFFVDHTEASHLIR